MKSMSTSKNVWTWKSHKRKSGPICSSSDASFFRLHSCSFYSFDSHIAYFWMLIKIFFHVAVLLAGRDLIARVWILLKNFFSDLFYLIGVSVNDLCVVIS